MDKRINQWGTLTSYSIDDWGAISGHPGYANVEFTGVAPGTPEVLRAIQNWATKGRARLPDWKEEWMCLYCGTPQPLLNRKCDDCGAPRNWLIG